ncbi:MAG: hypothetical protein ACYC9O_00110 [Candidatus Latescibacterota bacterium]
MEKSNENIIRQHIDEVITESYLRCLTEREVREYLKNFLDSCDCVLRDKAGEAKDVRLTGIKVALLKGYFLLSGDSRPVPNPAHNLHNKTSETKSDRELFAEQVVSVQSSILKLLNDYNPRITTAVLHNSRKKRGLRRYLLPGTRGRSILVQAGYFALFAAVVLMIWVVLTH